MKRISEDEKNKVREKMQHTTSVVLTVDEKKTTTNKQKLCVYVAGAFLF